MAPSPSQRTSAEEGTDGQSPRTKEATAEDIEHLRDWLSKQPHLPDVDDVFLERFLRGCKYSLSRCKTVMDMYFTVRAAMPEIFKNRDPFGEDIQKCCKVSLVSALPQLSPSGYQVLVHRLLDHDVSKFDMCAHYKRTFMILDLILQKEDMQGLILVIDMTNSTWGHVMKIPLILLKKLFLCFQDAYPVRIKELHFVNAPEFVDRLMELIKPLLKKKLKERIRIHSSGLEDLYKSLPQYMLPEEYGGQERSIKELSDEAQRTLEDHRDWFKAEEAKVADESKRPGKAVEYGELFGLEGSFRKLTID